MLVVDELLDSVTERTGLDDFGDERYRDGLECLVASINRESALTEVGELALAFQIGESLRNRAQVVDWAKRHPEVTAAPIERPLVVIGLPRTGTTLLSYLFDCDPARRSLLRWESRNAVPPPETGSLRTDPRVAVVEGEVAMLDEVNPEFKGIHYEAPDGPTEDVTILAQDFRSLMWECLANVPSYSEWFLSPACDLTSAYEYHRLQLQVLQSRAPGTWALKTPQHLLSLDHLLATYPDAQLVMTHRDPTLVSASMVSLVRSLSGTFSDADHDAFLRRHWPEVLETMVQRFMDWRDTHPEHHIVDLPYEELTADPIAALQRVYGELGDEWTPEVEERMRGYVVANPQGKHGGHRYSVESVGLDRAELRDRFAAYIERYAVPVA